MIGGLIGVVTMCLMVSAKEADRHIEDCESRTQANSPNTMSTTAIPLSLTA